MLEQRKFIRFAAEGKVILKSKQNLAHSINASLVDLSLVGMGVYSSEIIPVGTEINFIVAGGFSDKPVLGTGKIKYALEIKKEEKVFYRLGVEFTKVDQEIIRTTVVWAQQHSSALK